MHDRPAHAWAAALVLFLTLSAVARSQTSMLWRIGQDDDAGSDLALGPDRYLDFARDGFFVVGRSKAKTDWPYAHPGPDDHWAEGRTHRFVIFFGLASAPAEECRLVVDLVDTHDRAPPVLTIEANGRRFEHRTPKGGPDDALLGDAANGRTHRFAIDLPAGILRKGLNEIAITNGRGSWVVYDWLGLEGPESVKLATVGGASFRSVRAEPWLLEHRGNAVQEIRAEVIRFDPEGRITLAAEGRDPVVLGPELRQTVRLQLPPVEGTTPLDLRLLRKDEVLDERVVQRMPAELRQPVDWVDCLLGTGTSRWMLYPGPSMPFGLVKLSPDNQKQQWKAGYAIENIAGFSHLHSWTMGGLLTMPTTGPLRIVPGGEGDPDGGYRSRFRHETEIAGPGYYAVTLDDYRVRAELTSTTRTGFQRYTFPKADEARILFDLLTPTEYGYSVVNAEVRQVSDREIEGWAKERGGRHSSYQEFTLHFVARTDRAFRSMGGWVNGEIRRDAKKITGRGDVGVFLSFRTEENQVVRLQTGISLVSVEQARKNLEAETRTFGWDFDACRSRARKIWNDLLGRIEVAGGTTVDHMKFYTNLYRSYCSRTICSDVDGKYVDMYEKPQQLKDPASPVYGCDAFWNTFWNLNQLWNLITPDVSEKWVRSLLEIHDKGGWLPKGPTGIEYSSIMVASHEIPLIVAAYQHGIRGFDVDKAWEAVRHVQTTPGRPHDGGGHVGNRELEPYLKYGYIPHGKGRTSNTLEYAYDDWCVAQLAKALGKEDDHRTFMKRAGSWRKVFDPDTGFVRPKLPDGRWLEPFDPYRTAGFVEGNAWQYTWFVPQDVAGLIAAMGRKRFVDRLNDGLARSAKARFNATGDRFAAYPINHGNQPSMQVAWLFNHAGVPWLTQKWTRAILDRYYGEAPHDGWPGDEDQGQMGAWFAMSAIGLFQVDGGCRVKPIFEIGSPLFERIVIRLDPAYHPGRRFVIEARNNGPENVYVQSASLDGEPLGRPWFPAGQLLDGGTLVLEMGPAPNEKWGAGMANAPPSGTPR